MLLPKNRIPRWVIIAIDLTISLVSLLFAYYIRFDLSPNSSDINSEWQILSKSIWLYFLAKFFIFYLFKIHKGIVRHTSTSDFKRIFFANTIVSGLFFITGLIRLKFLDGYYLFPTSILLIEYLSSLLLLISFRFTVKAIYMESVKSKNVEKSVLIYGAGISGLITKRTIEKDVRISYRIVGFIDDNKKLKGNRLEGLNIYNSNDLEKVIKEEGVNQVIIAIQKPLESNKKKIIETCLALDVEVHQVPNPKSWINGEFSTKQIGKIKIEDLLGRDPIVLDEVKISNDLKDKVVLVTGAAGSIGSGLVRQISKYNPELIILLDQAESPLYELQQELKTFFTNLKFEIVIGDIRNYDRMENLFNHFKPNVVFHAAAYKHVPLMEDNPSEAIFTNVKGTKNLVDLANQFHVEKFVMISTDKAVNPTNVMGASKRIAEIYAQHKNQSSETKYITTRFGNVLGSNGSVIPLFQKQIENGGPITLTDERITRFFMTIPEACQLVLEAGTMGNGGEIFVFDMGESVKIIDLARKMIKLSGLEEGKDIEIKVTGLRPGEKLYEELLAQDENTLPTHHPQILIAKIRPESNEKIDQIDELIHLFDNQRNLEIVSKMKDIVPEYVSNNSQFELLDKK